MLLYKSNHLHSPWISIQFFTVFSFTIIFIVGNTVNMCVHSLYTVTVAYNHVAYMQRYSESHSINRRMYLCTCKLHRKYAVCEPYNLICMHIMYALQLKMMHNNLAYRYSYCDVFILALENAKYSGESRGGGPGAWAPPPRNA